MNLQMLLFICKINYFTFIEIYRRRVFILRTKIHIITLFLPVAQLVQNASSLVVLTFKTC